MVEPTPSETYDDRQFVDHFHPDSGWKFQNQLKKPPPSNVFFRNLGFFWRNDNDHLKRNVFKELKIEHFWTDVFLSVIFMDPLISPPKCFRNEMQVSHSKISAEISWDDLMQLSYFTNLQLSILEASLIQIEGWKSTKHRQKIHQIGVDIQTCAWCSWVCSTAKSISNLVESSKTQGEKRFHPKLSNIHCPRQPKKWPWFFTL